MGASDFYHKASGKNAQEAFDKAVEEALYEYGHRGYTGTIAEKGCFAVIPVPADEKPYEYAQRLMDEGDERIDDKWGPCGCVLLKSGSKENQYLFFGYAPS